MVDLKRLRFNRRKASEVFLRLFVFSIGVILASLPMEVFKDRLNYLAYALEASAKLNYWWQKGIFPFLSNEPVWLAMNVCLGKWLAPSTVVRIWILFPFTVTAWLMLRHRQGCACWTVLFFLMPSVLGQYIVHIRQGVAVSLFLLGWFSKRPLQRWLLWSLIPFIHASFFFVLSLYFLSHLLVKLRFAADVRDLVTWGTAVGIAIGLPWLGSLVGARQAFEYNLRQVEVSGLGFFFWLGVFLLFTSQGRRFAQEHAFELSMIAFYLGLYWFTPLSGRIFESAIVLVLLAGEKLRGIRKALFLVALLIFVALSYGMRIRQPWIGFGV